MRPEGEINFPDREIDMMRNAHLAFDFRGAFDVSQKVPGFAKPVVREDLLITVLVVAVQIQAEEVGCFVDLVHRLGAVTVIIMVAGGEDAIRAVHHVRFR